jgi:hypothetical protein
MNRLCADCGNPLYGRTDKKFCDDQCRSHYNNKIRTGSNSMIIAVNQILKRNRDILQKFNYDGKTRISGPKLTAAGFDLHYHTHTYETHKGDCYIFCYEYGYLKLSRDQFLLVKNH